MERLSGVTPVIYTDAYAANRIWDAAFGAYPLWVANYDVEEPDVKVDTWAGWAGFQYSDEGRVSGIEGNVDLDRFTDAVLIDGETPAPTPEPDPAPGREVKYVVKPGDTLWAIANRYNVTVDEIVQANAIQNPDRIYVGETLVIPVEKDAIEYTVKAGDTLWAIARRYNTTVSAIVEQNQIKNPDLIYPGEVIKIPVF